MLSRYDQPVYSMFTHKLFNRHDEEKPKPRLRGCRERLTAAGWKTSDAEEAAYWEWLRAVAPPPPPLPPGGSHWDKLPEELQQAILELSTPPVACGSLVDVRCYWVNWVGDRRVTTDFTPPHHSLFTSIAEEWERARKNDPRLYYSRRENGFRAPIQACGNGMCGRDLRHSDFSFTFADPETGEKALVCACVAAGNSYAHQTAKAAAMFEMLRRFGYADGVVAKPFKDADELVEKKKRLDLDWRFVWDVVYTRPPPPAMSDDYPSIDLIFELIPDEERAALVCHKAHHESNFGGHRRHGATIQKWCAQYGDDWWW